MLLFGDSTGNISLADRNFKMSWKTRVFRGEVKGLAYIYDPMNHRKQYIIAVGDEFVKPSGEQATSVSVKHEAYYMIKVSSMLIFDHLI